VCSLLQGKACNIWTASALVGASRAVRSFGLWRSALRTAATSVVRADPGTSTWKRAGGVPAQKQSGNADRLLSTQRGQPDGDPVEGGQQRYDLSSTK
jgi:hypothetical protein